LKSNKFIGLSDALWRSAILVAHAVDPSQLNFACCTWVNLRPYLNDSDVGSTISPLVVRAEGANLNLKVSEFENCIRRDFQGKLKRGEHLLGLKSYLEDLPLELKPGSVFDVSNSGYFSAGGPFVDVFLQQSSLTKLSLWVIAFGSATLFGGERRKIYFRFPFSQASYARKDAGKYLKGLLWSLQNIEGNMKV
jgi:hypothetical protein